MYYLLQLALLTSLVNATRRQTFPGTHLHKNELCSALLSIAVIPQNIVLLANKA